MKYSIFDVANWFLQKEEMTPKKLQKLCYYAQAWSLALKDSAIMDGVQFEAWVHGPVNYELWQKCKGFGWNNVRQDYLKDVSKPNIQKTRYLSGFLLCLTRFLHDLFTKKHF